MYALNAPVYWRKAGLTFTQYSNISGRALRMSVKPNYYDEQIQDQKKIWAEMKNTEEGKAKSQKEEISFNARFNPNRRKERENQLMGFKQWKDGVPGESIEPMPQI
eukprot:TRINITY_DN25_c0_g1_i1.p1 TRINITY_DN25_c0_g1~~TRINITY_DN25_c0_g1_i1.p1  ORF type:complete len:106 (-),score=24.85 TRINITY_DN25_c0_g1_i1:48-365(-)